MAYTKYSLTPADNNAAPPNGAPEGMLPSAVNDTMRDMMAQIRDCGDGIRGGTYTMTAPVITGGSVNGTTVGATTRSTGAFTTLASNGATTFTAGTASTTTTTGTAVITGGLGVSGRINAANFDGIVGANTAAAGNFTTLGATGVATFSAGSVSAPAITTTGDTNTGIFFPAADTIAFTEDGTESMRIDSSGNLLVGTNATLGSGGRVNILSANGVATLMELRYFNAAAGERWIHAIDSNNGYFLYNHNSVGVTVTNGATSWSAVSDERLKTDLQPIENAVDKVNQLRSVTGRYKSDDEGKSRSFLIAQDIQKVLPEAVSISKFPNSEDETEYLAASYTDVIPLLVAAIKELKTTVDAQAARIAALENLSVEN